MGPGASALPSTYVNPALDKGVLVKVNSVADCPVFRTQLPTIIKWGPFSRPCSALVDSGAEGNLIDATLVSPTTPLKKKLIARALNGTILTQVTQVISPVSFNCFWQPL